MKTRGVLERDTTSPRRQRLEEKFCFPSQETCVRNERVMTQPRLASTHGAHQASTSDAQLRGRAPPLFLIAAS